MSNYPDNMDWAAHDARYGYRREVYPSRDAHRIATLAEVARRMGFEDCVEILQERVHEALTEQGLRGEDHDEAYDAALTEAKSNSDIFLCAALLTAIGDHNISLTRPSAIERRIAADRAAIAAQVAK